MLADREEEADEGDDEGDYEQQGEESIMDDGVAVVGGFVGHERPLLVFVVGVVRLVVGVIMISGLCLVVG